MTAKENLSGSSDTGRASNSVPELTPVFSFRTSGGGDVYVYLVRTEVSKNAIVTFDNTISEVTYGVQTLTSNTRFEADMLVHNAKERYQYVRDNPFRELEKNKEAMQKLAKILASFFDEGE